MLKVSCRMRRGMEDTRLRVKLTADSAAGLQCVDILR